MSQQEKLYTTPNNTPPLPPEAYGLRPEDDPEYSPKKPNNKKRIALIGGAVAGVAGIALTTGLLIPKGETTPPPAEEPVATEPIEQAPEVEEPAEPAVERYEGYDYEMSVPLPAELEAISTTDLNTFIEAEIGDKMAYGDWIGQNFEQFKADFYEVSLRETDKNIPVDGNDPMSLIADVQWQYRYAMSLGSGTPREIDTNGPLNVDLATRYMLAYSERSADPSLMADVMQRNTLEGEALNVVYQARGNDFGLLEDAQNDPNINIQPNEVTYQVNGEDVKTNGFLIEFNTNRGVSTMILAEINGRAVSFY